MSVELRLHLSFLDCFPTLRLIVTALGTGSLSAFLRLPPALDASSMDGTHLSIAVASKTAAATVLGPRVAMPRLRVPAARGMQSRFLADEGMA